MSGTLQVILGGLVLALVVAIPMLMTVARRWGLQQGAEQGQQQGAVAQATVALQQTQLAEVAKRQVDSEAAVKQLQSAIDSERVRAATAEASLQAMREALQQLETRLQGSQADAERLGREREALAGQLHQSQGEVVTMRRVAEERDRAHEQARVQLKAEFEVLANRLFEDKGKAMLGEGKIQLDTVLMPLRERLADFQKQMQIVHETDIRERSSLKNELASLLKVQATLGEEAQRLSRALTSNTHAQGSWGELTLQRLLEASNLQRGTDYELQVHARDDEGASGRPDAVIFLPEDKALVVDAKVSLKAFVEATASVNAEDRERCLAAHAASVRNHLRGLADQRYPELLGTRTLDLTILFLPSEPAFAAAMSQDPSLWLDAFQAKVVIVSPTTLLATLRVAAQVWQMERQNRHAATVFAEATKLIDKFAAFVDDLDDIGRNLTLAQRSWDEARGKLATGKGNLISRITKLHKIGASNVKARTATFLAQNSPDQMDDESNDDRTGIRTPDGED